MGPVSSYTGSLVLSLSGDIPLTGPYRITDVKYSRGCPHVWPALRTSLAAYAVWGGGGHTTVQKITILTVCSLYLLLGGRGVEGKVDRTAHSTYFVIDTPTYPPQVMTCTIDPLYQGRLTSL
jgi:hypothetical protein